MMTIETADLHTLSAEYACAPGETFWQEGEQQVRPLLIHHGVVAYRRGNVAVGLLGPGKIAVPLPGLPFGPAETDLVAITDAVATPVDPEERPLTASELAESSRAILKTADRLGNMTLPQRLAALLLDITEMTGQPIVSCRQDILAMAVAARRETVATILAGWRDADWIQTRYRRCKVIDRAALMRIRDKQDQMP